jgi:hypothetical protein
MQAMLREPPTDDQTSRYRLNPKSLQDFVGRYPRVLGKIAIAAQLPSVEHAAIILRDARERRRSYSEWVLMQYGGDAVRAVRSTLGIGMRKTVINSVR